MQLYVNLFSEEAIYQARSHWLGWSGFNLTTYTQFMQLRFNKLISSVALRTSFFKNATVF